MRPAGYVLQDRQQKTKLSVICVSWTNQLLSFTERLPNRTVMLNLTRLSETARLKKVFGHRLVKLRPSRVSFYAPVGSLIL